MLHKVTQLRTNISRLLGNWMTGKSRRCIFCFELILETAPAIISPWIRELGVKKWTSTYQKCDYCDLGFFSYRYGPVEMGLIYGKYRSNEYTKFRNRWEPWYSKAYNANHDSKDWVESRKLAIENFIYDLTQTDNLRIADIGGDKGQFIPNVASLKYVVELSNKVPDPGIVRVDSLSDLPEVDLIIYAHVLEHVSDPIGEVLTLFTKARQIYIEVPWGVPKLNCKRKSFLRFCNMLFSSFFPYLWRMKTSPATGRQSSGRRVLQQSEHLTFFSETSIMVLAKLVGAEVVVKRTEIVTPDHSIGSVWQCLFTIERRIERTALISSSEP